MNMPDFPLWTLAPFAMSVLIFGLPHGALDHLVAAKIFCRRAPGLACCTAIIGGYLATALLGWLLWVANPALAFVAFIGLTCYHWGQGELEAAARWRPNWLGTWAHRASYLLLRGAQPMILPLVFNSQIYADVADTCLLLFGHANSALPDWIRASAPTAPIVCAILWIAEKLVAPRLTRWALEKLALDAAFSALFLFVHPLFGIGLYFLCWHAPHHMNRLRHFLGAETGLSWLRLMWLATPLTFLTLIGLVMIGVGAARHVSVTVGWLPLYLVALACLTWPHAILVTLQDAEDGIWEASHRRAGTLC
jgi:Brp/Blh family beta-carotene 15,15'-monooxygenase